MKKIQQALEWQQENSAFKPGHRVLAFLLLVAIFAIGDESWHDTTGTLIAAGVLLVLMIILPLVYAYSQVEKDESDD